MSNSIPSQLPIEDTPVRPSLVKRLWAALWAHRADILLGVIFLWVTALYALLMFRDRVPTLGLLGLGVLWLVYAIFSGRLTFASPMDLPVLGLLGLLPLSLAISIDRDLSLPKVYGLILGIALFFLVVNSIRSYQRLLLAILGLIFLSLGTVALGWLTADWGGSGFSFAARIQALLLRLLPLPSGSGDVGGTNLNTIGGALVFFVPLFGSLLWDGDAFHRLYLQNRPHGQFLNGIYKALLIAGFAAVLITLILTKSRSAYLGCGVGLLALAIWKEKRFLWVIPVLLAGFLIAYAFFGEGNLVDFVFSLDVSGETTLQDRFKLWRYTVAILQDFPLAGGGIFTFRRVLDEFYSFNLFTAQRRLFFHAHNFYLSIAFDLGIPGLVLYMAMLSSSAYMILRTIKIGRSILKSLLIGLACGLLAHHAFGLMDANVLGTKLGAILWIFFGLVTATYVHKSHFSWKRTMQEMSLSPSEIDQPGWDRAKRCLLDLLIGFGYWLLISLAAVIFINLNPYLSLAFAITGGLLLGIILTRRFRRTSSKIKAVS